MHDMWLTRVSEGKAFLGSINGQKKAEARFQKLKYVKIFQVCSRLKVCKCMYVVHYSCKMIVELVTRYVPAFQLVNVN